MRIAFYAPLKAIDHPVPSGDRRVARGFVELLRGLGHDIILPSRLRSFDRDGDQRRQARLAAIGMHQGSRLIEHWLAGPEIAPELWFTYHGYHKAPDHLGPRVADRLAIPYVMAEASLSARQAHGPWAAGHATTMAALRRADIVLAMTDRDRAGLMGHGPADRVVLFPPFLDATPFQVPRTQAGDMPILLAVGMMRDDVKRRSFETLFDVMSMLTAYPWQLVIVGDGPARAAIEQRAAKLGPTRVRFLGEVSSGRMPAIYAAADVYVWPGFGEAYGMAILEAMAAGLPVVAGRHGGIPEIIREGRTGLLADDADGLVKAVRALLADRDKRREMGEAAALIVAEHHDHPIAAARLQAALHTAWRHGKGAAA